MEYSYNSAIISSSGSDSNGIAGIVGTVQTTSSDCFIENCYNYGNISGTKIHQQQIGGIIGKTNHNNYELYLKNVYNKGTIYDGWDVGGIAGALTNFTLQGEILNYGNVYNALTNLGAICGYQADQVNNSTKRASGGNCPSSIKTNGNGTTNSYDANLSMPSVYSIVNAKNTGEFSIQGTTADRPKLVRIE